MSEAVKVEWDGEIVEVPVNVINKELYAQWLIRKNRLTNHKDRYYTDSKSNIVDLCTPKHPLRKKLKKSGLNESEIELIVEKGFWFRSENGQLINLQRKTNSLDGSYDLEPTLELREAEMIDMFGRFFTESEVHRIVTQEWGYSASFYSIRKYAIKNKEKILEVQRKYEEEYTDITIGSKRSRLGKLNYLLHDRMQIYEKNHKVDDSREIRAILQDARKEVEGESLKLDISGKIDIEATLTIEYQETILKTMTIQQLVLSRVAARLNINPIYLMSRLVNSYYSKFNGFRKNEDLQNTQPIYPSSINYDFDELIAKNERTEYKLEQLKEDNKIEDAVIIEDIKTKLLKAIKAKKENINNKLGNK